MNLSDTVKNTGLHLAMEWGPDFLKPIQGRLALRYPELSAAELDEANRICQEAMRFGHSEVEKLAVAHQFNVNKAEFALVMQQAWPWVDASNISGLFNQGMYYAMK